MQQRNKNTFQKQKEMLSEIFYFILFYFVSIKRILCLFCFLFFKCSKLYWFYLYSNIICITATISNIQTNCLLIFDNYNSGFILAIHLI
jgi:hypothetical protein